MVVAGVNRVQEPVGVKKMRGALSHATLLFLLLPHHHALPVGADLSPSHEGVTTLPPEMASSSPVREAFNGSMPSATRSAHDEVTVNPFMFTSNTSLVNMTSNASLNKTPSFRTSVAPPEIDAVTDISKLSDFFSTDFVEQIVISAKETVLFTDETYELVKVCHIVKRLRAAATQSTVTPPPTSTRRGADGSGPATTFVKKQHEEPNQKYNLIQLLSIAGCALLLFLVIFLSPYVYNKIITPILQRKTKRQKRKEIAERVSWMAADQALVTSTAPHKIWPLDLVGRTKPANLEVSSQGHDDKLNSNQVNEDPQENSWNKASTSLGYQTMSGAAYSIHSALVLPHGRSASTGSTRRPHTNSTRKTSRRTSSARSKSGSLRKNSTRRSSSLRKRRSSERSSKSQLYNRSMSVKSMCGHPTLQALDSYHSTKDSECNVEPLLDAAASKLKALEFSPQRKSHDPNGGDKLDVIEEYYLSDPSTQITHDRNYTPHTVSECGAEQAELPSPLRSPSPGEVNDEDILISSASGCEKTETHAMAEVSDHCPASKHSSDTDI